MSLLAYFTGVFKRGPLYEYSGPGLLQEVRDRDGGQGAETRPQGGLGRRLGPTIPRVVG